MLDFIKKSRQTVILSTLLILTGVFGLYQFNRAQKLTYYRDIEYNRVFAELTEYVDDLEISLLKGMVVSTNEQMAKLSADLYGQANAAKANLALLPVEGRTLSKTSEFLSQVGEYAHSLSGKMLRGEKMTEKEIKTMEELLSYSDTLKTGLDKMLVAINEGRISFDDSKRYNSVFSGGKTAMAKELAMLEEEFHNYPSLIYDGPFSQHLSLKEAVFVENKNEISKTQAKELAKKFTGKEKVSVSEIKGKLPAYSVKSDTVTAEFTRRGGTLLLLLKDRFIEKEKLSLEDARKKAEKFLSDKGFPHMKESYYEKKDGSVVINYAYKQDDYVVFSDLVKVKVALDNGEITGFESRGYIMNHTTREIPVPVITKEKALSNINSHLKTGEVTMAVIPLESGKEAPCYQIKGTVSDKHFLIYVNTQTGFTEDIQILLENEGGILAV